MSQPYVGQVICVGFNFAPVGWALCDGSLLPIQQFEVLYNLIGTTYGGNGTTTFALPDLRGRTPVHQGSGYVVGQPGGAEAVNITLSEYPTHTHPVAVTGSSVNSPSPAGAVLASATSGNLYTSEAPSPTELLNNSMCTVASGAFQPHANLQPFVVCNWIISLYGQYPSQG
jgi:microcystin-dependent protein